MDGRRAALSHPGKIVSAPVGMAARRVILDTRLRRGQTTLVMGLEGELRGLLAALRGNGSSQGFKRDGADSDSNRPFRARRTRFKIERQAISLKMLCCAGCSAVSDEGCGWRLLFAFDSEEQREILVTYCPTCAEREFGARRSMSIRDDRPATKGLLAWKKPAGERSAQRSFVMGRRVSNRRS